MHLGQVAPAHPTVRTSTKGKRQVTLTKLLVSVDQWLRTRKYKGTVLAHTAQVADSVRPQDLDPSKTAEASAPASTQVRSSKKKKRVVGTRWVSTTLPSLGQRGTGPTDSVVAAETRTCQTSGWPCWWTLRWTGGCQRCSARWTTWR